MDSGLGLSSQCVAATPVLASMNLTWMCQDAVGVVRRASRLNRMGEALVLEVARLDSVNVEFLPRDVRKNHSDFDHL